jgi:GWxTD domain-containing protein
MFSRSKIKINKSTIFTDTSLVLQTDIQNTFVNQFTNEQIQKRLATIYPIANASETRYIDNLIKENKENNMKMFYYNFWKNRNPENPIGAYTEYEMQLIEVNKVFGMSFKYGFETDRGRVYLQYGAPNSINKSKQSGDMLPYEVWDYYALGNQKNVKFIFYTKDRSTNDYQLAFSNKRGEVSDPNWMTKIQNIPTNSDFEKSGYNKNYGNQLDRDMNLFIDK